MQFCNSAILQFVAIRGDFVINSMMVEGIISACSKAGENFPDPSRVAFFRDLAERSKRCGAQVLSHLTEAPIGLAISAVRGTSDQLIVSFSLPVACAFVGQGLLHGWTESLQPEKRVAERLLRKILVEQEFTPDEATAFTSGAKATSASLVWLVEMDNRAAAQDLLARAVHQVKVLHDHKDDDFYGIQNYVSINNSTEVSLQIVLSSGNGVKLSMQPEHLSQYMELHVAQNVSTEDILAMTKSKIRMEVTIGWQLLGRLKEGSQSDWQSSGLESCVDSILTQAGFMTKYVPYPAVYSSNGYPTAIHNVLALLSYPDFQGLDGEYVADLFASHLKDGIDLRVRPSEHKFLDGAIGERLHYTRRWHVPDEMQDLIVSTTTEPRLIQALSERHQPPRQEIVERDTSPRDFAEWCHASDDASSFKNRSIRKSKRLS